jgi:hypothetical protein
MMGYLQWLELSQMGGGGVLVLCNYVILKNKHLFYFFLKNLIKEFGCFGCFKVKEPLVQVISKSKNYKFLLFQKHQRINNFHQITDNV